MKTKFNLKSKGLILGTLFISSPLFSNAQTSIIGGISDATLLAVMLGIIGLLLFVMNALAKSIISVNRRYKKENGAGLKKDPKAMSLIGFMILSTQLSAAETESGWETFIMSETLFWTLVCVIIFLGSVIAYLFKTLQTAIKIQSGEVFEEEEETSSVFEALHLTDNVAIEDEEEVMMDHEYDGIRELDNNLPPWWKYMFYATIIFGVIYLIRFHITGDGKLSHAEYLAQMEEAEIEKEEALANAGEQLTEENVTLLISEADITAGAAIYKGNCATCHNASGGGGAGPNLTDEYWIHGGGIQNVFKTIKYGVPAKGMIAWQTQFNPSQMQQVASYVLSLQGSNPADGISPQGDIWIEKETEAPTSDSTNVVADTTTTEVAMVSD